IGKPDHIKLSRVMTKDPTTVKMHMSVASIGHLMIWDGLEVMPVVEDDLTLIGIISRQDVMKAMQTIQRQPQVGATFEDQIAESVEKDEESLFLAERKIPAYSFVVTPQMTDTVGTLSIGVLSELVSNSAKRVLVDRQKKNAVIEQVSVHAVKVIQIENVLKIQPRIFELGRRTAKIDVEVYRENVLVAKAIVICQLMQRE
ncbi:MAG: CBS domain-containing protein, partial [Pisciglobus halotolerans]|nr:CBS domain-containing protein [Pisciglobus halotolerans]